MTAKRRPRVGRTIVAITLLVLTTAAQGRSLVRQRIYRPDPMPARIEWSVTPAPETVTVHTRDGLSVKGYRWPASKPQHVTLLFFHGNGGNRYEAAQLAAPLRRPDAEIIVASYRGYGDNPGSPTETGLANDAAAFLDLAQASGPRRVYLFGYSLGGSVALRLAADEAVDGVVTLGTFSSLRSITPEWVHALLPDEFDSISAVRRLRAPLLLLHGTSDEVVPIREAVLLKQAGGGNARLLRLTDAPHHLLLDQLADRVWQEIEAMPVGTGGR